jgi:hypothetical protein
MIIQSIIKVLLLSWACLMLMACSASLEDYRGTSPEIDLERYLNGKLVAYGIVQSRSNKLERSFCAELDGKWSTNEAGETVGTLDEVFYFNDGEVQTRIWQLQKHIVDGRAKYYGTASDVNGTASGAALGQAFYWEYNLTIPLKNDDGSTREIDVNLEDWIYQIDEHHAFNRADIKKFGFRVGSISLFFDRKVQSC